jgi:hypothetical protein
MYLLNLNLDGKFLSGIRGEFQSMGGSKQRISQLKQHRAATINAEISV